MSRVIHSSLKLKPARLRWSRVWIAVVAVGVVWPFIAWAAGSVLIKTVSLPRADAVVVLSGSSAYIERSRRAAELYHEGRASRIILTNDNMRGGWSEEQQTNPLFVERAREELLCRGVPAGSVEVVPVVVYSTYDEAVAVRAYAMQRRLQSLLFVTSPYHTRRALWTLRRVFRESGVDIGLEAVAPGAETPTPAAWWLSGRGWRVVASEYPKLVYYHWQYR